MIYDCIMFNDELDLLEIRLHHHAFVDRFILIESTHTYSGQPKPLHYDAVARPSCASQNNGIV